MSVSCKCSNFIATVRQLQRSSSVNDGNSRGGGSNSAGAGGANNAGFVESSEAAGQLSRLFRQKTSRNFQFYTQCMDFFQNAYGPITDLSINAISQPDLIYSLTLNESWQLIICINCKVVVFAKSLTNGKATEYLINFSLLTNNETLALRRCDKSYSEIFGLIIMDHAQLDGINPAAQQSPGSMTPSVSNMSIGSFSSNALANMDSKQQRVRQLSSIHQAQLQREITETNARIERYTEQQFNLLKSFRDKSDQEIALLLRAIEQISEQSTEQLDRAMPPALDVTGGPISYAVSAGVASRRRNTISSRRELNGGVATVPTTPTTALAQPPSFLVLPHSAFRETQQQQSLLPSATILQSRKMSNFETPPATPEATPMSVGNSPTFRQQNAHAVASTLLSNTSATVSAADDADDCLFDLEDVDAPAQQHTAGRAQIYQQQQHQVQFQPLPHQHSQQQDNMSDVDEGDAAEEAEDALDLDSSMPITMHKAGASATPAQILNFAKSLPIEIANSPLAERANNNFVLDDEDVLDNTVDIAASIKALAKSVHGEAVFGDLPRPRLRSQI